MKRTLYLDRAASLKNQLEKGHNISIDKDNEIIEKNNTIEVSNLSSNGIDLPAIEQRKQMKSDLLKNLYLAILAANLKKLKGDTNCLAYYIKTLSELEREKLHLVRVEKEDAKKKTPIKRLIKFFTFIKPKEILRRNESINKNIEEIKEKISKYNKETKISIDITQEMSDFLKSLDN